MGHSTYHAATAQFRKLYSHGLVLDTFYTFSKVLDDCDTDYGVCTGVEPVTNRSLNKGRAGFDMNHRWVASFTYEVPIGKGRRFLNRGGILNFLIGGTRWPGFRPRRAETRWASPSRTARIITTRRISGTGFRTC